MFDLTNEEKGRLKHLNADKGTVFALKKLFWNALTGQMIETSAETLAAERIAIERVKQAFEKLSVMSPEEKREGEESNPV